MKNVSALLIALFATNAYAMDLGLSSFPSTPGRYSNDSIADVVLSKQTESAPSVSGVTTIKRIDNSTTLMSTPDGLYTAKELERGSMLYRGPQGMTKCTTQPNGFTTCSSTGP